MTFASLDGLPKELIAHVATFVDPSSVLSLSFTCRAVRSACYDTLVFKSLLIASQQNHWNEDCLDVDSLASRAGNTEETWARYALADQQTWQLSTRESPLELPLDFINYLPELLVLKHPFVNHPCWGRFVREPFDQKPVQLFCHALAILACENEMPHISKTLCGQLNSPIYRDHSTKAFILAVCSMTVALRTSLKTRLAAWPYNSVAVIPYIPPPTIFQIPLRPINDSYRLPAPYSRRAIELLGPTTTAFGSWDSWYRLHNLEAFKSTTYLTDGSWCGYYMSFGVQGALFDPPMGDIRIRLEFDSKDTGPTFDQGQFAKVFATDCLDAIDRFDLRGTIVCLGDEVKLSVRKQYRNIRTAWDWDCRLTPFGIAGFWGVKDSIHDTFKRLGIVWLWKSEWTSPTTAVAAAATPAA